MSNKRKCQTSIHELFVKLPRQHASLLYYINFMYISSFIIFLRLFAVELYCVPSYDVHCRVFFF
jgi:hypothetical protein